VAVLGASGGVGQRVVEHLLQNGFKVVAQTRSAERLAHLRGRAEIHVFEPRNTGMLERFVKGADAVVFTLGTDRLGATRLFSEATAALIQVMERHKVKRLVVITGVGAGETRGHGGLLYDWFIFPLFTRQRYADKDRQEALIAASDLDWTIVRPAPFSQRRDSTELEVHAVIAPDTCLTHITRDEVAAFVVRQIDSTRFIHQRPFIGHPADIGSTVRGILKGAIAGLAYFGTVFAAGFAMGALRVAFVAPNIGETTAVLLELPIMLALSWIACRWLTDGLDVARSMLARSVMGGLGLVLLLLAEFAFSNILLGRTLSQHLEQYREMPAILGLLGQLAFAAFPAVQLIRVHKAVDE